MIFFNGIIRPVIEGYLNYCFSGFTSMTYMSFNTHSNVTNGVLTIGFAIGVAVFPFLVWAFLYKFRARLEEP